MADKEHQVRQITRGTADKINAYTGPAGELIFDTTNKELVVFDGATKGGIRLATKAVATTSVNGLMSSSDKTKLNGIQTGATAVAFTRSLTSGTKVGTITINGTATDIYCNNNTTYSAGTGLSLSSTTFSLANSGVTAGSYGPTANASPAHGATFSVPQVTVDAMGRVTSAATRTITLPAAGGSGGSSVSFTQSLTSGTKIGTITIDGTSKDLYCQTNTNTTYSAGTGLSLSGTTFSIASSGATAGSYGPTGNSSPGFSGSFTVPQVTVDATGRVTSVVARTITLPANPGGSNSDEYVVQNVSTSNSNYPILLCPTANASSSQGAKNAIFGSAVKVNPSTGTITATTFSGAFSGNSTTATRFQTARTIWGQSFNGSANVAGGLSQATSVSFSNTTSSSNHGGFIDFFYNGAASRTSRIIESSSGKISIETADLLVNNSAASHGLSFAHSSTTRTRLISGYESSTGGMSLGFHTTRANSDKGCEITDFTDALGGLCFSPYVTDGTMKLGNTGRRWAQLYASSTSISTSDRRLKDEIELLSEQDAVLTAWGKVNWVTYKMKDAIAAKGSDNARIHCGLIAQDIDDIFTADNLDISRYGLFCFDKWEAQPDTYDADGNIARKGKEAGEQYSMRYTEALCLEAAYQRKRADKLEAMCAELAERVAALEARQ